MKVKLTVEITVNVPREYIKEKVEEFNADDPFTMKDYDHDFLVQEFCVDYPDAGIAGELQQALTELEFGGMMDNDFTLSKVKVVKAE